MIEYLKKLTEKNAGFAIQDRGDCQLLSELIIERTDELISYNTLRRLFGLASYVKPSKNTLDTLARFNGYKDYVHYLKLIPTKPIGVIKRSYIRFCRKILKLFYIL